MSSLSLATFGTPYRHYYATPLAGLSAATADCPRSAIPCTRATQLSPPACVESRHSGETLATPVKSSGTGGTLALHVKAFLDVRRSGHYQVFNDVNPAQFEAIETLLSKGRVRFDYDAKLKRLILRCGTEVHERAIQTIGKTIDRAMEDQDGVSTTGRYDWAAGGAFTSRVDEPDDAQPKSVNKFVADYTIYNDKLHSFFVVEVAFSQTREEIIDKLQRRMTLTESLVGAVVVDLIETPAYVSPARPSNPDDYITDDAWIAMTANTPPFSPITRSIDGKSWVGAISCTIDVIVNGPKGPKLVVEKAIIIPIFSQIVELDAVLRDLWKRVVHQVASEEIVPVSFAMDWQRFRDDIRRAVRSTARHEEKG